MNDIPRGSEKPVGQWLEQIGATHIRYEGAKRKEGPPDFVVTYEGNEIAVEVTLLHDNEGWSRERKEAFHSELRAYIEEVVLS